MTCVHTSADFGFCMTVGMSETSGKIFISGRSTWMGQKSGVSQQVRRTSCTTIRSAVPARLREGLEGETATVVVVILEVWRNCIGLIKRIGYRVPLCLIPSAGCGKSVRGLKLQICNSSLQFAWMHQRSLFRAWRCVRGRLKPKAITETFEPSYRTVIT